MVRKMFIFDYLICINFLISVVCRDLNFGVFLMVFDVDFLSVIYICISLGFFLIILVFNCFLINFIILCSFLEFLFKLGLVFFVFKIFGK